MFPTGWLAVLPFPGPGRRPGASACFPTRHAFQAQAEPTGAVPPVLLAAGEHSGPHRALAFIALALCFQPDASLGYCWPFQGSRSEVLIRLPTQIRPTAVIIQHASKLASPLGTVSSAPRDFTVSVSLCWALGTGTGPRGKAVTGTCCSLHICRDSCAPKHCRSLRGHFRGHVGCCHPCQDLLSAFWPSTSGPLSNTQGGDSAPPHPVPDGAGAAGVGCRSRARIWHERFLMIESSLTRSPVLYLQGTG